MVTDRAIPLGRGTSAAVPAAATPAAAPDLTGTAGGNTGGGAVHDSPAHHW
jgi:hypothetical protein